MQVNRAPSPFRTPSPYESPLGTQYTTHPSLPTGPAKVGPGSITYTTSTGPDGRITYEPYRAVAASYRTPSGIVSGIQWVKIDSASVPLQGAQPFIPGPTDSWNPGATPSNHDWHRSEEKRRKQDGMRELELSSQKDSDYALRIARERDAQSTGSRDRRKSFNNGSQGAPVTFPSMNGGTYPTHPSQVSGYPSNPYVGTYASPPGPTYPAAVNGHSRNRSSSGAGYSDLANQFSNLGMDHQKDYERDGTISSTKRSHKYSDSESFERARTVSGNYTDRNAYQAIPSAVYPAAPEPFANPQNHYPSSPYIIPSPNMHAGEVPYGSAGVSGYPTSSSSTYNTSPAIHSASIGCSTTPFGDPTPQVYPRGHILEGQSVTSNAGSTARSHGPSRAASPNPSKYAHADLSRVGKSPRVPVATMSGEPQQLPAPEAFSRPINGSSPFIPFEMTKIIDMEDFYDMKIPKMSNVLASHDIYQDEWMRCMQDLGRSWTGQLPIPSFGTEGQPRRSTLAADLINLWNTSFFFHRGVELMLYKGKERRTGPQAGLVDNRLPLDDDDDDDDTSSDSSTSDSERDFNHIPGAYGKPNQISEVQEARRRRYEEKKESRRRRKARRKAKAREKAYSVYIACAARGPAPGYATAAPMIPGGYGAVSNTPGYNPLGTYIPPTTYSTPPYSTPSSYGPPPIGIPKTRSQGYGGSY